MRVKCVYINVQVLFFGCTCICMSRRRRDERCSGDGASAAETVGADLLRSRQTYAEQEVVKNCHGPCECCYCYGRWAKRDGVSLPRGKHRDDVLWEMEFSCSSIVALIWWGGGSWWLGHVTHQVNDKWWMTSFTGWESNAMASYRSYGDGGECDPEPRDGMVLRCGARGREDVANIGRLRYIRWVWNITLTRIKDSEKHTRDVKSDMMRR